jgi:hypothetical protein
LWEAADRICGKRLKVLIPMLVDAMERHGHLDLDPVIKARLFQISAATIDRMLANARSHIDGQRKRRGGISATRIRVRPLVRNVCLSAYLNDVRARSPTHTASKIAALLPHR